MINGCHEPSIGLCLLIWLAMQQTGAEDVTEGGKILFTFWAIRTTQKPNPTTPVFQSSARPAFSSAACPVTSGNPHTSTIPSSSVTDYDEEDDEEGTEAMTDETTTESPLTEMPICGDTEGSTSLENFPVYWNVPTFQCHKYGFNFSRVGDLGLVQNYRDEFRGEEIAILYDPGEFPALLDASAGRRESRNGGVPQEGSMRRHLEYFAAHIEKLIPDKDFKGLAIIDFEHWRPIWRQNFGSLSIYRDQSKYIERRRHPFWFSSMIEIEATYRYELSARAFLLDTLRTAKRLRPLAKWGYYGYPFCFNYTPHNNRAACSDEVVLDNDNLWWLFTEVSALYPSLYLRERDMLADKRAKFVEGRLHEVFRVASGSPIYPYIWYKYHDTNKYLSEEDLLNVMTKPATRGCQGVVIWGASRDVNTKSKCEALSNYLEEVIGPVIERLRWGEWEMSNRNLEPALPAG